MLIYQRLMLLHVASMLKDQKNACNILLVGAFNPSALKNMKVCWDDYSQYVEK